MKENEKDLRNEFLWYVFEVREHIVSAPLAAKEAKGNAEVMRKELTVLAEANTDLPHRSGDKIKLSPLPVRTFFPQTASG